MTTTQMSAAQTTQQQNRDGHGKYQQRRHDETGVSLDALSDQPTERTDDLPVGSDRERISLAEARRALPVGSTVQAHYLARPVEGVHLRTVVKQSEHEMISEFEPGQVSHLRWAKQQAERDANGLIIVRDENGTPFVAYRPLAEGEAPVEGPIDVHPDLVLRHSEARLTDDPDVLADIAESTLAINRESVAANQTTPSHVLTGLASDDSVRVRRAVASHPSTEPAVLDRLADDPDDAPAINDTKVRYFVAANPRTSTATLDRLAADPDDPVRSAVARHANTGPETLRHLATSPAAGRQHVDPYVRQSVAANPRTPADVLARWERSDGFTMPQVAKNPSTPPDVLARMATDTSTGNQTRAMVASNPTAPREVLARLAREEDRWVREHAATNPALGDTDLDRLAGDHDAKVRRSAATNPALSAPATARLQVDPDPFVRTTLAKNSNLAPATLQALSTDGWHAVRAAVATHPATTVALLRLLADDEASHVATTARRRLGLD